MIGRKFEFPDSTLVETFLEVTHNYLSKRVKGLMVRLIQDKQLKTVRDLRHLPDKEYLRHYRFGMGTLTLIRSLLDGRPEAPAAYKSWQTRYRILERQLTEANAKLDDAREALLNIAADGEINEDWDGDVDDHGRSYSTCTYRIKCDISAFKELVESLGIDLGYEETPLKALERTIDVELEKQRVT